MEIRTLTKQKIKTKGAKMKLERTIRHRQEKIYKTQEKFKLSPQGYIKAMFPEYESSIKAGIPK